MKPRGFLDTDALAYAFDDQGTPRAEALLGSGCVKGVQAPNEFTDVARRQLGFARHEVDEALHANRTLCRTVVPLDPGVHDEGPRIARQHRLASFDAPLVATAVRAGCDTFRSEDLHDGRVIDGRLSVADPSAGLRSPSRIEPSRRDTRPFDPKTPRPSPV